MDTSGVLYLKGNGLECVLCNGVCVDKGASPMLVSNTLPYSRGVCEPRLRGQMEPGICVNILRTRKSRKGVCGVLLSANRAPAGGVSSAMILRAVIPSVQAVPIGTHRTPAPSISNMARHLE